MLPSAVHCRCQLNTSILFVIDGFITINRFFTFNSPVVINGAFSHGWSFIHFIFCSVLSSPLSSSSTPCLLARLSELLSLQFDSPSLQPASVDDLLSLFSTSSPNSLLVLQSDSLSLQVEFMSISAFMVSISTISSSPPLPHPTGEAVFTSMDGILGLSSIRGSTTHSIVSCLKVEGMNICSP